MAKQCKYSLRPMENTDSQIRLPRWTISFFATTQFEGAFNLPLLLTFSRFVCHFISYINPISITIAMRWKYCDHEEWSVQQSRKQMFDGHSLPSNKLCVKAHQPSLISSVALRSKAVVFLLCHKSLMTHIQAQLCTKFSSLVSNLRENRLWKKYLIKINICVHVHA